jgi:hypothetical protein
MTESGRLKTFVNGGARSAAAQEGQGEGMLQYLAVGSFAATSKAAS